MWANIVVSLHFIDNQYRTNHGSTHGKIGLAYAGNLWLNVGFTSDKQNEYQFHSNERKEKELRKKTQEKLSER